MVVDGWATATRDTFGTAARRMPPDLVALYEQLGATRLQWRFIDDAPTVHRGGLLLRGVTDHGWYSCEYMSRVSDLPDYFPELLRPGPPLGHRDEHDNQFPEGWRYNIIEGREEGGVMWYVDPQGRSSYKAFGADGDTRPLGADVLAMFEELVAHSFVGAFGNPASADPSVRDRLARSVAPRITADLEVLENRALDWATYRDLAFTAWINRTPSPTLAKVASALRLGGLQSEAIEGGRKLARATAAASIPPAKVTAVMKAIGARTRAAFDEWRAIHEGPPQSLMTISLEARTVEGVTNLDVGSMPAVTWVGPALADLPGFVPPPGVEHDLVRFTPVHLSLLGVGIVERTISAPLRATIVAPSAMVAGIPLGTHPSPMQVGFRTM